MTGWLREIVLTSTPTRGVLDIDCGEELWLDRDIRLIDEEKWISRNWELEWQHTLSHPCRKKICEAALHTRGPVLEIAAGPGGGNLSPLLHMDPKAKIIVSDLEPRIVERWCNFLHNSYPEVAYAAFDACNIPLRDGSVSCVSSRGGISSCRGDAQAVLGECNRVLQPGGLLVLHEMCLAPSTLLALPRTLREAWVVSPWMYGNWQELLCRCNFRVVMDHISDCTTLHPVDSALAYDAAQFNVQLEVVFRSVIAEANWRKLS